MFTIKTPTIEFSSRTGAKLVSKLRRSPLPLTFSVLCADRLLVEYHHGNPDTAAVSLAGNLRVIRRDEVLPTVRLFLDANRLRGTLDTLPTMFIR